MTPNIHKLLAIAVPVVVVSFVVFTVGGKLATGLEQEDDPVIAAKLREVGPVLENLRDHNQKRFEKYLQRECKGLPSVVLFDHSQLQIDYSMGQTANDFSRIEADAKEQFQRLLCRNSEFTNLYDIQNRLLDEHNRSINISVTVSGYATADRKLLWRTVITPQSCIEKER